jgi:hypothetical protein
MVDVDDADRAFAYWQEWRAEHRGKLDALRATMSGFEAAAAPLANVAADDEVTVHFNAFRRAHEALSRTVAALNVDAWLPDDYERRQYRRYGLPGADAEDRPPPVTDLYYFAAWRGENSYPIADARHAISQVREALDALKRITPRSLRPRSNQFARSVEDLKSHLARINTTGWNEAPEDPPYRFRS